MTNAYCTVCGARIRVLWELTWVHDGPIPANVAPHQAKPT